MMNETLVTGLKYVGCFAAALVCTELGAIGTSTLCNDADGLVGSIKELKDPTPVKVKEKGLFKKTEVITINPFTSKATKYTGNKKPVNKKPLKYTKVSTEKGGRKYE